MGDTKNMFWGLEVKPGKRYETEVGEAFRITKACLVPSTADGKVSTLFIETENSEEFILANLSLKNFNETLDISFNEEEKICFRASGPGTIHLTGNLLEPEKTDREYDEVYSEDVPTNIKSTMEQLKLLESDQDYTESNDADKDSDDDEGGDSEEKETQTIKQVLPLATKTVIKQANGVMKEISKVLKEPKGEINSNNMEDIPITQPSLGDVLDGVAEAVLTNKESSPRASTSEQLIDGMPAAKAFRHREVMLIQAFMEKYGQQLGGTSTDTLVKEFLGAGPDGGGGKVDSEEGSYGNRGALDIDTQPMMEENGGEEEESGKNQLTELTERAKFIPLRLTFSERKLLRLCEAALNVSEYTDKVDILNWKSKTRRIYKQIRDICAILSGLAVAADYEVGQKMIKDRSIEDNAEYFASVFEIGRRHKILNPESMRTDYGKLVHMLMDSQNPDIQRLLEFKLVKKVTTVYDFLKSRDSLMMLKSQDMLIATTAIMDRGRSTAEVQQAIKCKESAMKRIVKKFSNDNINEEEIEWCLYSIGDNSSFLVFNRDPVDQMISYLDTNFSGSLPADSPRSLRIRSGYKGARLSHPHPQQHQYCLQSLTLWREIQNDMFKLWCLAEKDLLASNNYYSLRNTGQGLNRVQSAPAIGRAMHDILHRAQRKVVGSWIGSSVVHLGDHNVPNALTFIDKYTQVPRILNPIVQVIEAIPRCAEQSHVMDMIVAAHGSVKDCQLDILQDFFKHAFDGSGADNFYDAGSCIDGRLTSAWNWCNKLDKKNYYPIFKLTGFTGFDGSFKN